MRVRTISRSVTCCHNSIIFYCNRRSRENCEWKTNFLGRVCVAGRKSGAGIRRFRSRRFDIFRPSWYTYLRQNSLTIKVSGEGGLLCPWLSSPTAPAISTQRSAGVCGWRLSASACFLYGSKSCTNHYRCRDRISL